MITILQIFILPLTALLSIFYTLFIRLRHFCYDKGILPSYKAETWTISIGNITVGGTGKTPLTIAVVDDLKKCGYRTVIISRGYKRSSFGLVIVSDGDNILADPLIAGDEPYLLASSTGVPVICSEDRMKAAEVAVERFKADFIVLDDGFQHRRMRRDFDIIAIDSMRFLGNHLLLPAGILRDTINRLYKADLIILTKTEYSPPETIQKQLRYLERFGKKIILTRTITTGLKNQQITLRFSDLISKKVSLFCGLGLPKSFFAFFNTRQIGFTKTFIDHHKYSIEELEYLIEKTKKHNCDYLITTEKDFYNFPKGWKVPENLLYLCTKQELFDLDDKPVELTKTILNCKS